MTRKPCGGVLREWPWSSAELASLADGHPGTKRDGALGEHASTNRVVQKAYQGPWHIRVGDSPQAESRQLKVGDELRIGSGPEVELRVVDPAVSRRHCCLAATREGLQVRDLGSTNGVWLGGVRVESAVLPTPGPELVIGATHLYTHGTVRTLRPEQEAIAGLVGSSPAMRQLYQDIRSFAPHNVSVLIQGETGTGKDLVARALHELSGRRGQFVVLNIGAMSESLADAELFGHRKGAFTGALSDRKGAFELAHRGTLFLDEIADMSPAIQVKLLRALEARRVRPLGASAEIEVDVRIVAASWASLEERAARGEFRVDLLHRLSTALIRIEPLWRRRSDIKHLAAHLLQQGEADFGKRVLTDEALARLRRYNWPGNVRQLKSVLSRASMRCSQGTITAQDIEVALPSELRCIKREPVSPAQARALVAENGGNISAAARVVGLPRTTFRALLDKAMLSA